MHVYTITLQDKRTVMHVEAKSAHEAKRVALEGVEVKRLNGSEILDLTRRGIAIVSADTGVVANAEVLKDTDRTLVAALEREA